MKVGLFADTAPTVHEAEPAKNVRSIGFDAPSPTGKIGDTKSAPAVVGVFDSASSGTAGEDIAVRLGRGIRRVWQHRRGRAGKPAAPPDRVDVPVEILFKPTPVYTEEARSLKLEGEVLLDVEFAATGTVSVLKVVRGLGHGLDEAATAAAKQIRFKPAQSGGRPIRFWTTVHIVFRLA